MGPGGALVFGAIGLLFLLGGGGGRRRSSSSSSPASSSRSSSATSSSTPRGSMEMGQIRTTRDLQSERLGIGVSLWDDLRAAAVSREFRARSPYSSITGPVGRVERWLANVRGWRAEGDSTSLANEARWMSEHGYHVASHYADLMAAQSPEVSGEVGEVVTDEGDATIQVSAGMPAGIEVEAGVVVHEAPIPARGSVPDVVVHDEG